MDYEEWAKNIILEALDKAEFKNYTSKSITAECPHCDEPGTYVSYPEFGYSECGNCSYRKGQDRYEDIRNEAELIYSVMKDEIIAALNEYLGSVK